jgi:hypothetical protein
MTPQDDDPAGMTNDAAGFVMESASVLFVVNKTVSDALKWSRRVGTASIARTASVKWLNDVETEELESAGPDDVVVEVMFDVSSVDVVVVLPKTIVEAGIE